MDLARSLVSSGQGHFCARKLTFSLLTEFSPSMGVGNESSNPD
jgi:hypothetical protein